MSFDDGGLWAGSTAWPARRKFIEWVDEVLQLDYGPTIDSYRLQFYMMKDFAHLIDQLIQMAITKRVQNLDINLSMFYTSEITCPKEDLYTFPFCLFTQETGSVVRRLYLNSCNLGPLDVHFFSSLVDLQLENVPINQGNISDFLFSCPNLEKLCLVECMRMLCVYISGSSLKLKESTISNCYCCVRKMGIDARNLTRLEYFGAPIRFSFLNTPLLSNVTISFRLWSVSPCALRKLFSSLHQLESLFLSVEPYQENKLLRRLPVFANLKKLVLQVKDADKRLGIHSTCPVISVHTKT